VTVPDTRVPHQARLRRSDRRVAAATRSTLRIAPVIHHPASLLARTRLLMDGDTTWQHLASGRHRLARSAALNLLLRWCARARSTGILNREFYIRHGTYPRRIWPDVCPRDTEMFGAARAERRSCPARMTASCRSGFVGFAIPVAAFRSDTT
jgi:hypothetical protein